MNQQKSILADLYIQSNSVQFGSFKISAHEVDPGLPLTPLYLHYPKPGEPGYELLPEMFEIVGKLFYDIITNKNIQFDKIAGIPAGADLFAVTTAQHFPHSQNVLLRFKKETDAVGKRSFSGPTDGVLQKGDRVLILDDHTSGGYNKSLFIDLLSSKGARVTDVLTIVDRQQGATEFLRTLGVTLHSIFTISELISFYKNEGLITAEQYILTNQYIQDNQIII
ncbi:hypothetical protein KBD20_03230 [Candidatus Saccharibacteria bacterium]|nr:hypothetical protein [Candidatus Saccharibacteria bacterium]